MKKELSKCSSKPTINKKSIKIASKLNKNSVERLYRAKLEKNNEYAIQQKLRMIDQNNTFSPSINDKSRGLARTVQDLYSWNERRNNKITAQKEHYDAQNSNYKVEMCPGSTNIIYNLDDLVDKCNEKISSVREYAHLSSRNSQYDAQKFNTINFTKDAEVNAMKSNRLNIRKPKLSKKRKIKGE